MGNLALNGGTTLRAVNQYEEAERKWPWLKFNLHFKNKVSEAKKARENHQLNTPAIIVFLKSNVSEQEKKSLLEEIENFPNVRLGKYISSEEAFKRYKEMNKNEPVLLEMVSINMLPPSVEVYMTDWSRQKELKKILSENKIVDTVIDSPDY